MKLVEGVRKLFGTMSNIPAESDTELTYKDIDGDVITLTSNDTYKDDGKHGIVRESDGKFVSAFIGDNCVIPNASWTPETKTLSSIKITKKPTKITYAKSENLDYTGIKVQGTYTSGDKEDVTSTCTFSPAEGTSVGDTAGEQTVTVTCESKTATFKITVTE